MRHLTLLLLPGLLLAGAATLSGCADSYQRAGTWHPTGVNDDNLHAMVADPHDLEWGVSEPGSNGQLAAVAVTRLRTGHVKALPDNGISKIGGGGAAPADTAPASTPAGGS